MAVQRRCAGAAGCARLCTTARCPAAAGKKRQILRELRQLCREELPEYVQPAASAYKIIPEMPLTPAGKADYRKLEEEVG